MLALAILLLASQAQPEAPPASDDAGADRLIQRTCFLTPSSLGTAPIPLPAPHGLPEAKRQNTGTFLPQPLDLEVERQLRCGHYWPEACQATLDGQKQAFETQLGFERRVQRHLVERIAETPAGNPAIPTWVWLLVAAGGGVAVGGAAGLVVGFTLGR